MSEFTYILRLLKCEKLLSSFVSCGWIAMLWVSPTMEYRWLENANCESRKTWNEEFGLHPGVCMEAVRITTRNSRPKFQPNMTLIQR